MRFSKQDKLLWAALAGSCRGSKDQLVTGHYLPERPCALIDGLYFISFLIFIRFAPLIWFAGSPAAVQKATA